ncbi:MAG TPA: molybdopterin-synthase adenylyltransferase MoeB [Fulvivirga sp.]|nr:molybdopterin-synthase adenylyltransferase MoeB [Fulvivirga sp.]
MLNQEEIARYQRQLVLPLFGSNAQQKLKKAKVLIVGAGGLGAPVSLYLTAAGVGEIGIIDNDTVDITNLQRQVLFHGNDIGKSKSVIAAERMSQLNSHAIIKSFNAQLTSKNALELIKDYDLVIDCTDNFPTRYLINDACVLLDKPFIYGSIYQYEGQVSVFNYNQGVNYRDLYPVPPAPESVPNCATGGVLGTLPGIIGSIQANEAIKLICGIGEPLHEKLFIFDTLSLGSRIIKLKSKNTRSNIKELIDYDVFCNVNVNTMVKEITVSELHQMMENKEDFQLIDVREPHEAVISSLKGELIPLGTIPDNEDKIATDKKVIIHCRSGARSAQAVNYLQNKLGLQNLYNLKGGILAWSDQIDPSVSKG